MTRLVDLLDEKSYAAVASNVLSPIQFRLDEIEEDGLVFPIAVGISGNDKPIKHSKKEEGNDPFANYNEELYVGSLSPTHFLLLNKYNILRNHFLVVTTQYMGQDELLTPEDFGNLYFCLCACDGLGFFNSGERSGCSQHHKHMQVLPYPFPGLERCVPCRGSSSLNFPLEDVLRERAKVCTGIESDEGTAVFRIPEFRFVHCIANTSDLFDTTDWEMSSRDADSGFIDREHSSAMRLKVRIELHRRYTNLLEKCSIKKGIDYSFVLTRQFMLVVPRSRHAIFYSPEDRHCDDFSEQVVLFGNSAVYSGFMLVKNDQCFEYLKQVGIFNFLSELGIPEKSEAYV